MGREEKIEEDPKKLPRLEKPNLNLMIHPLVH
jgi:hypothetical protein